jgi:phosphate transport system substrate-binding protein
VTTKILSAVAAFALASTVMTGAAFARDQIRVVGSSTVYPFTTAVAEQFGKIGQFKTPVVESTGTGGGFKLFCEGVGEDTADVSNASRAITKSEFDTCAANGVNEIVELKIGFDGIVMAESKEGAPLKLTRTQVFLALAKQVPGPDGTLIANPNVAWSDIDPSLPNVKIEVLGPPPTSGTRDAFLELVMESGCGTYSWLKELKEIDEKRFKAICHGIREDGAYIDAGENDNVIVQKLSANPKALGIFGYSFLEENLNTLHGATIDGVVPTFENIASAKYPVSRALYVYVKKAHIGVIPGLAEFVQEYTSDKAFGDEGYLVDKGLVPLPASEAKKVRADVSSMKSLRL